MSLHEYAAGLAADVRQELGVEVELLDGKRDEFTLLVDGEEVTRTGLLFEPSTEKLVAALREARSTMAGTGN